ncbi:hypothetical protein L4X54_11070 [Phocaeicola vulgatus]|uniref:hypothetical protein n=1 Tax=Phocaeicola vulgatus TaxID=821 RepID=UPI001F1DC201|nr:hypothetical protein [Phocaeicola vulgatus]MCG0150516.1 hypothetical protein [Phocaeicola vulgatus]MCG0272459.1 hypothetical protein [Phocaeicola vulgatus]
MPPPTTAVLVACPNPARVRWGCTTAPPIERVTGLLTSFLPKPSILAHPAISYNYFVVVSIRL